MALKSSAPLRPEPGVRLLLIPVVDGGLTARYKGRSRSPRSRGPRSGEGPRRGNVPLSDDEAPRPRPPPPPATQPPLLLPPPSPPCRPPPSPPRAATDGDGCCPDRHVRIQETRQRTCLPLALAHVRLSERPNARVVRSVFPLSLAPSSSSVSRGARSPVVRKIPVRETQPITSGRRSHVFYCSSLACIAHLHVLG